MPQHSLSHDAAKPSVPAPAPAANGATDAAGKETSRQMFVRLANARMTKAHHAISVIGNLSSARYEYTADDVAFIRKALMNSLDKACARFDKDRATESDLPQLSS